MVAKKLESGDKIERGYPGKYEGRVGYIYLTHNKLVFAHEEGFLHKTYNLILDLPYQKITKISRAGKDMLELMEVEGKKYDFKIDDIAISMVEKNLEELVKLVKR